MCLQFGYAFDNFTSLDPNLLYPPLLGIPTRGLIPEGPTGETLSSSWPSSFWWCFHRLLLVTLLLCGIVVTLPLCGIVVTLPLCGIVVTLLLGPVVVVVLLLLAVVLR